MANFSQYPPIAPFGDSRALSTNKVLRNTYMLLSLTLVSGAIGAYVSMAMNFPVLNTFLYLAFAIGMPMLINATRNSVWGLVSCFIYTAGLGMIAGPIISIYASKIGPHVPIYAFATTAAVFGALTAYCMTTRKDFSFMGGFLMAGTIAVLLAIVANFFLHIPVLSLIISTVVVLLASGGILYSTSQAINDGEANYIVLASSIYADLWSMFMSLMNIFGFFSNND